MRQPQRIVITGGPGAGKSSLIEGLRMEGYQCQKEVAREVILKYMEHDINPWSKREEFIKLVYEQIFADLQHPVEQLSFCDRGILDCLAYLKEGALSIPAFFKAFDPQHYYAKEVFILPPWESIFCQDWARKQEFEQAVSLYKSIKSTYQEFGFELVEVPMLPLQERVEFVLHQLKKRKLLEWEKI